MTSKLQKARFALAEAILRKVYETTDPKPKTEPKPKKKKSSTWDTMMGPLGQHPKDRKPLPKKK
jgi:hypothetical protein